MTPFVFIVFGATGDLMQRKLMPAIYHLTQDGEIGDVFVVGVGRRDIATDGFRDMMNKALQSRYKTVDEAVWQKIASSLHYIRGTFEERATYEAIVSLLASLDKNLNACVPRFFYLATPPQHYETILTHLDQSKLDEGCLPASAYAQALRAGGQGFAQYTRVFIEKPFGRDLATARHLDQLLATIFDEKQIYRIDHYLGKETVQNILAFRFANGMFEPTWNSNFIDHVQITLAEQDGVGSRGAFYDGVGALRDVVQNHMLEMLATVAMEQPKAFGPTEIRDERAKVLASLICIKPEEVAMSVVRGQYTGFTKEKDVDPASRTETFVALKLFIQNQRWAGVPFYLRTGKGMPKTVTEISLHYKKPACTADVCFFNPETVLRNVLTIRVQPGEGMHLRLMAKQPGFGMKLTPTEMRFHYQDAFDDAASPEAYERLLLDAIGGDQTLFARTDAINASWKFVTTIIEGWKGKSAPLLAYQPGTWGPQEADTLIGKDGRHWFLDEDRL